MQTDISTIASDFLTSLSALVTGLWWLWAFIGLLVVACLVISGALLVVAVVAEAYDRRRWGVRRG